jgi:hypothetical protein
MKTKTESKYVCENCGSEDVEGAFWVNLNTDAICEAFGDEHDFCNSCSEHVKTKETITKVPVEQKLKGNHNIEKRLLNIKEGLLKEAAGKTLIKGHIINDYQANRYDAANSAKIHDYILTLPMCLVYVDAESGYDARYITAITESGYIIGYSNQLYSFKNDSSHVIIQHEDIAKFLKMKSFEDKQ